MSSRFKGGAGQTRERRALTHKAIEALRPEAAPYRVPDARCVGLAVRVAVDGRRTWDLAFRVKGSHSPRRVSLGGFPDVSLDAARDRANDLTRNARAGIDLVAKEADLRRAQAEAENRLTVGGLIVRYEKERAAKLRTAKEIGSRLRRALAPLLSTPAEDIRRRDVRPLLDQAYHNGLEREAEKRRQTVGAMFRWALSRDLVSLDPTAGIEAFPAGPLRDRVLTSDEIKLLWNWLPHSGMRPDHADVLRLELALGARCGEIAGICAEEVDLQAAIWTLPAVRSKNGRERMTPIVGIAREIIGSRFTGVSRGPLFLSAADTPLNSSHVGLAVHARQKRLPIAYFSTHDLRRTVASHLAEMGISLETIAIVIGHDAGARETRILIRHYVRSDFLERKRAALERWNERLVNIIGGSITSVA